MPINSLIPGEFQPRKYFDKEKLKELTNSIKENGILQPIIVREAKNSKERYEIVAGERRWQAAKQALLNEVPVIISNIDDLK